jgi:uncharacterized protein YndB with AHSA1/START domain
VISSHKDVEKLTLTFVAEFEADVDRLWQVWADPRQLERWWGPPEWPATFEQFDFRPGGEVRYFMTGPAGEKSSGWWRITAVEAPHRLEFEDRFADDSLPSTHSVVTLSPVEGGTRMTTVTRFADLDHLEKTLAMGVEDGTLSAMAQIDDVLGGA